MTNMEFRMGLKMALEAKAHENVNNQLEWVEKAVNEVIMYLNRGDRFTQEARNAKRVLQERQNILSEFQNELNRVMSLDVTSSEPIPWWMGTNYTITDLWCYMPTMFKDQFNQYYNDDMRHTSASIIVDGKKISIRIPD